MDHAISLIEWGVAHQPLAGQVESGDSYLVRSFQEGVLVAVVDGLGHGSEAAAAADIAITTLARHAQGPLGSLIQRCHEALRAMRGVVMSLAAFHTRDSTLTWLGVGDVEGVLLRADARISREFVPLCGGIVGYQLPRLRPAVIPIQPGDTLIFATDGIRSAFADTLSVHDPPQRLADHILAQYGRGTDDALVLVARYLGAPP